MKIRSLEGECDLNVTGLVTRGVVELTRDGTKSHRKDFPTIPLMLYSTHRRISEENIGQLDLLCKV